MKNQQCKNCQEPVFGRVDKRFCDDHCRNAFHNNVRRARSSEKRPIQIQLNKNYRILSALRARGIKEVHFEYLRGCGFDERYCTERSAMDRTIIFDLVLEKRDQQSFRLVQRSN